MLQMPGVAVFSCVTKASSCHHTLNANHWHCLWGIPSIIGVKSNIAASNYVCRFIANMFVFCRRALVNGFKHADIKVVSASRAQRSLTRGLTIGVALKAALSSSTVFVFQWRILAFRNWKWHVIIAIKTDLSEFGVTMHSDLSEHNVGCDFLFARALVDFDHKPLQNRS